MIYLTALAVTFSQFKLVPLLGTLAETMSLPVSQISLLMSVFTVAGFILAIPGAVILSKLGPKNLFVVLMAFLIVGNVLGALSITNFTMLLVSRALEGVALALILTTGIVYINQTFPAKSVGIAVGIYTTYPGVASFVMLNVTLPINEALGMSGIWWVCGGFALLMGLACMALLKSPEGMKAAEAEQAEEKPSLMEAAQNVKMWMFAICQFSVAFVLFTFLTVFPLIYAEIYGLDAATANLYSSINGLFSLGVSVVGGFVLSRSKNVPLLTMIAFAGFALTCFLTTRLSVSTLLIHSLAVALCAGFIIPAVLYAAPFVVKRPTLIGHSISYINMLYFLGMFVGTPLVLSVVETSGWDAGTLVMTAVSGLAVVILLIFLMTNKGKIGAASQAEST